MYDVDLRPVYSLHSKADRMYFFLFFYFIQTLSISIFSIFRFKNQSSSRETWEDNEPIVHCRSCYKKFLHHTNRAERIFKRLWGLCLIPQFILKGFAHASKIRDIICLCCLALQAAARSAKTGAVLKGLLGTVQAGRCTVPPVGYCRPQTRSIANFLAL